MQEGLWTISPSKNSVNLGECYAWCMFEWNFYILSNNYHYQNQIMSYCCWMKFLYFHVLVKSVCLKP